MDLLMQSLLGAGLGVMIVADAVVGVRLLLLAGRTRRLPELCFGISFVALGVLGYPLSIAARQLALSGGTSAGLLAAALAFQNIASLSMFVATWQTFRPAESWPRVVVVVSSGFFLASLLGDTISSGVWTLRDGGPWYYVGFSARAVAYLWAAIEAGRYYGAMRRRLALGLADPVVVDRFRLWAISASSVTLGFVIFFVGRLSTESVATSGLVLASTSIVGLSAGVTVWLAFVSPESYRRRVRSRAQPSEIGSG